MELTEMLALEAHGPDTYVGVGPSYPWGGLYGGQIIAQALRAAANTVPGGFAVHSLHGYFIRRGDADEPVRFEVDRLRNGRSFVTRSVVARQAVGAILNLSCSFQQPEGATEADASAALAPAVAPPDALASTGWSEMFERRFAGPPAGGRASAWMRLTQAVPAPDEDPVLHACGLAYVSDDLPTDAVFALHPEAGQPDPFERFVGFSLDHAMWFHRPLHLDAWHLLDFTCDVFLSSRGLARGHVFDAAGTHVATVTQEVLLRPRRA